MSKPFRVESPKSPGIVRLPDGKFAAENPAEVFDRAQREGKSVIDVVSENPSSLPTDGIPWDPAGARYNDAGRKPFKID